MPFTKVPVASRNKHFVLNHLTVLAPLLLPFFLDDGADKAQTPRPCYCLNGNDNRRHFSEQPIENSRFTWSLEESFIDVTDHLVISSNFSGVLLPYGRGQIV